MSASLLAGLATAADQPASPRRVALVFDDGPVPSDALPLLAILEREHVPASFSLVGARVREHPETARAIAQAGFEINNHSENHLHPHLLSQEALDREIAQAQQEIKAAAGVTPRWYWAPFVEVDERVRAAATKAGLTVYPLRHLVVAKDYDPTVPAADIRRNATTDVRDGSVILLHEWRRETRDQLPAIIAELRRQGCTMLTFSELADEPPLVRPSAK